MFNAIWGGRKSYEEIRNHAAAVLRQLVEIPRNSVTSIAALIGLWHEKARLRSDAPQPPIAGVVLVILRASAIAQPLAEAEARRIWEIFRALVEVEHGRYMDEKKEAEAINLVGKIAAELDVEHPLKGNDTFRSSLEEGLTKGTSDHNSFVRGYSQSYQAQLGKRSGGN